MCKAAINQVQGNAEIRNFHGLAAEINACANKCALVSVTHFRRADIVYMRHAGSNRHEDLKVWLLGCTV